MYGRVDAPGTKQTRPALLARLTAGGGTFYRFLSGAAWGRMTLCPTSIAADTAPPCVRDARSARNSATNHQHLEDGYCE